MMHIVESSDLREEPSERLIVLPPIVDRSRPIVTPLDHRARLQPIRAHLVNMTALPVRNQRPVAERQHILQMTRSQISAALAHQRHIVGVLPQRIVRLIDLLEAAGVAPQVQALVHIAHLDRPRGEQLARDFALFRVHQFDRLFAGVSNIERF